MVLFRPTIIVRKNHLISVADNLYDFLNQFTLQDAARLGRSGLQSAANVLNRYSLKGRQAAAATRESAAVVAPTGKQGPTQDVYLQPGVGYFDRRSGRFIGPENKHTVVSGIDEKGEVDRTKSDLYRQYAPKPFPTTPEGQFDRYFKTPEMDQYFGTASRGKKAPADVAAMEELAGQLTAPKDTSLASYYRAQSAVGRAQMPEIQKGLGYAEGSDLAKWAAANPMLAQRLYAKKQAAESSQAPATPGYEAGVQPLTEAESFSMAANGVPAPWNTQGEKVSGEFSGVVPFQAAKTTGEGMPAFQTTGEKAAEFLKRPNISALF